jgi:MFS family permease
VPDARVLTRRLGLLRHHDFRHLWTADIVSEFGTRISYLALPLLAVTDLHATTFQVSLLRTVQTLAYLLLGLQVGAWCDRMRRKPVLVAADLGRAALFAWLPVAAALGVLDLAQVYAVIGAAGVLTVFFEVAAPAFLPLLVRPAELVEGNTKLAANASVAAMAAPTLGGALVQWLGAATAIGLDAATYLWSGLWLRGIHTPEPAPRRTRRALRHEIGAGLRLVFGHPLLRAFGLHSAGLALFQSANTAISVVFLVRQVHLSPVVIGALGSVGLLGALTASALTSRLARIVGSARLLWLAGVGGGVAFLLYPLVAPGWRLMFQPLATFGASCSIIVLTILQSSYQQAVCPRELLGRMNATLSFLTWGAMPLGSVLGGVAGSVFGLRATLWLAGAGVLASAAWLVCSPLRTARELPTHDSRVNDAEVPAAGNG